MHARLVPRYSGAGGCFVQANLNTEAILWKAVARPGFAKAPAEDCGCWLGSSRQVAIFVGCNCTVSTKFVESLCKRGRSSVACRSESIRPRSEMVEKLAGLLTERLVLLSWCRRCCAKGCGSTSLGA